MSGVERWEDTGPIPVVTLADFDREPPPGGDIVAQYPPRQRGTFTHAQVAGIDARVRHAALPWWRRWREPRPPTWADTCGPHWPNRVIKPT